MRYDFRTGVYRAKSKTKKYLVGGLASLIMIGGVAAPTFAAAGDNASPCGAVHGAFASENGNFGRIGQDYQGAPNYHGGVMGQEPGATGYNNSHTNCQG